MAKKPKQPKQTYSMADQPGVKFVIERGAALPPAELAEQVLKEYFRAIGRTGGEIGGLATSKAKKQASRLNGRLGGRPKKQLPKSSGKGGTT